MTWARAKPKGSAASSGTPRGSVLAALAAAAFWAFFPAGADGQNRPILDGPASLFQEWNHRPNRPPEVQYELPDIELFLKGGEREVELRGAFIDPDYNRLSFSVSSSVPSVVNAYFGYLERLYVDPLSAGVSTVTVTATDRGGLSASQSFTVTVSDVNRPPRVSPSGVPDVNLVLGDTEVVEIWRWLYDPDDYISQLTYAASSSAPSVVTAVVADAPDSAVFPGRPEVTLTAVGVGTATVAVTVTDPDGLSVSGSFTATVAASNRSPAASGALPGVTLAVGGTEVVDVSQSFVDPDGDPLRYRGTSSARKVVIPVVVDPQVAQVTLTAVGVGTAWVTVTVTDPYGLSASRQFKVTVSVPPPANRPPRVRYSGALRDMTLAAVGSTEVVDVSWSFVDPDDDPLTFAVLSARPGVVTAVAAGAQVTLTAVAAGSTAVVVRATDPEGLSASQQFTVVVLPPPNRPPAASGALPAVTLAVGGTEVVDVSQSFVDPDDDPLTFELTSSDRDKVLEASVAGARVTLTGVRDGAAWMTVTAMDPGGLSASQSFTVTVGAGNRPPAASGALPGVTLAVDGTEVVDVSQSFVDPEGDPLTFAVSSSARNVVMARVRGARVTLTGMAAGAATVTVTAEDPGGLSASQSFTVTVGAANRPPAASGALPGVTLGVDVTEVVDVSRSFVDPDDDPLTFAVSSSAPKVVTASVAGARVTLTAVAAGAATVTVTATDPGGLSASQSFTTTVSAANRPPAASGALPGVTLGVDGTEVVDVSQSFVDPDDDPLTFAVSSSAPKVVTAVAAGARVTLTAVAAGAATVTVTATDPGGLSASQSFTATVSAGNRPPAASGALPGVTLWVDGTEVVDVSQSFVDPDDDPLTFAVSSSAPEVVTAVAAGARVTLTAVAAGAATVTVTATDPGGLSASQSFTATVSAGNRPPAASGALRYVRLAPGEVSEVDVSRAFVDPDGDALTFAVSSSAPEVLTAVAAGARVTLTAVRTGTATVTVTATDPEGLSASQSFTATVRTALSDRGVLEALYAATGGANWTSGTNWRTDAPLGTWRGVRTDDAGRVTGLDLRFNGLSGVIPAALGDLTNLESLDLSTNDLRGAIPPALGSLTNLRQLDLANNGLSGAIPAALGDLTNLESLHLINNDLSGAIPPALGSLTNLRRLGLSENGLSGAIPAALGDLTNLESLGLTRNGLSGAIPPALGNLTNLEFLLLDHNGLSGAIPVTLGNLTSLEILNLDGNGLSGAIPVTLGNLTNLEWLVLSENGLSGAIPVTLGNLTSLEILHLDGNDLSGAIPVTLGNLTGLEELTLSHNGLIGPIPDVFGNLSYLSYLAFDGNTDLSGPLPPGLRSAELLHVLDISNTGACAPRAWQDWLTTLHFSGRMCGEGSNRPPAAAVALPPARLTPGEVSVVDVSQAFVDPDGDALTWAVSSSAPKVLTAVAADARVTLTAVAAGTATVTVTATDPGGLSAAQSFTVTVSDANRPPAASGALPGVTLGVGGTEVVDVSQSFVDPDDDPLTFAVSSSAPKVLTAVAADARVTLTAVAAGTATVTVTATDPGGLSVAQSFTVTVSDANRPPAASGALPGVTLGVGGTEVVDVSQSFVDPDDDPLTFAVSSSAPKVLTAVAADARVTLTAVAAGTATVTVTATDPGGLSVSQSFTVTVSNRPPAASGALPGVTLGVGGTEVVDVSQSFVDPDDDPLTFAVSSSAPKVLTAVAADARVTLTAVAAGAATVTVTATDPGGLSVAQSFTVTVSDANRPPTASGALPGVTLGVGGTEVVDVSQSFVDPDDDPLTFAVSSSAPKVLTAVAADARVTLTAVAAGTATVTVTATDPGGLSVSQSFTVTVRPASSSDRAVLEALYAATGGANWTNGTNWRTDAPLGEWRGVTTDGAGRVTGLDLDDNGLSGAIPDALGDLTNLERLNIGDNGLSGAIPDALGSLVNLRRLNLGANDLSGAVPAALGSLTNLEYLSLFNNDLSGAVPAALGGLTNLEWLNLGANGLSGPIPVALGGLTNLEYLYLENNGLSGPIPAALGGLTNLAVLSIGANGLSGSIPVALGSLTNLRRLFIGANDLSGSIPDALGSLANLEYLHAGANGLSGPIPAALGSLTNLAILYLNGNTDLSGPLPSGLRSVESLRRLDVSGTQACAPRAWQDWLATFDFSGRLCDDGDSSRPPTAAGALPDLTLTVGEVSEVDVSQTFADSDGDTLSYAASSSALEVATVTAAGARVTVTAVGAGVATVTVTATDPGGLSAAQSFRVTVSDRPSSFTDDPIQPGVTPVRAVHFTELRTRIDALRAAAELGRFPWTDPVLTAGVTRVRLVHLAELREALAAAYAAAGRTPPVWTDAAPAAGATPIRAAHLMELRAAVTALE